MNVIQQWAASVTNYTRSPSPALSKDLEEHYHKARQSLHPLPQNRMSFVQSAQTSPNFQDFAYDTEQTYAVSWSD
jgi:hypothetical protein